MLKKNKRKKMGNNAPKAIAFNIPLDEVEAIKGPVAEVVIPRHVEEKGFLDCSIWVTTKLMFAANKLGLKGIFVSSTETKVLEGGENAQVILLYGVRVQEKVYIKEQDLLTDKPN